MNSGAYQLLIELKKEKQIQIGKLGCFIFPEGFYIYTGSAMKNLYKRVERHLKQGPEKKNHWHIDYLLEHAQIKSHRIFPSSKKNECALNKKIKKIKDAKIIIEKFGSSDCKSGCKSHLIYFAELPASISAGMKENYELQITNEGIGA